MSARIFPWLEPAPTPDQLTAPPAKRPEGPKPLQKRSKKKPSAANPQRRWDKAKIV